MTAPRHAIAVPHPHLRNAWGLVGDLAFIVVRLVVQLSDFLERRAFGLLVGGVAALVVAGVSVWLHLNGLGLVALLVALVGGVGAGVITRIGDKP